MGFSSADSLRQVSKWNSQFTPPNVQGFARARGARSRLWFSPSIRARTLEHHKPAPWWAPKNREVVCMDGYFLATDGERARGRADRSETGAPSRAPSQGTRLFTPAPGPPAPPGPSHASPKWGELVQDHEAVNQWLRSIPRDERPGFLVRLAANIEVIHTSELANLEPGCEDAVLSYAILIEYAQHLGSEPCGGVLESRTPGRRERRRSPRGPCGPHAGRR